MRHSRGERARFFYGAYEFGAHLLVTLETRGGLLPDEQHLRVVAALRDGKDLDIHLGKPLLLQPVLRADAVEVRQREAHELKERSAVPGAKFLP